MKITEYCKCNFVSASYFRVSMFIRPVTPYFIAVCWTKSASFTDLFLGLGITWFGACVRVREAVVLEVFLLWPCITSDAQREFFLFFKKKNCAPPPCHQSCAHFPDVPAFSTAWWSTLRLRCAALVHSHLIRSSLDALIRRRNARTAARNTCFHLPKRR